MPLFGRGKQDKPDYKFDGEYMGGHKLYPKKRDTKIWVYPDRIFLKKLELENPFTSMTNIENSDAERLTKTRMILVPFFLGFFWKKKYLYTVIDYNDGLNDQSIVLDLHRGVENVQQILYRRMIASRQAGESEQQK